MKLYFHEVEKARPCILIVPGRYAVVSPSEGEIVAKKFYEMGYQTASAKPNAVILSYPVITSGEVGHEESFRNLLGDRYEELKDRMSLEFQVTEDTPRTFIWHTFEDQTVLLDNTLLFVQALYKKGIPVEYHVFPQGPHGIGLANELTANENGRGIARACEPWSELAGKWLNREFPWWNGAKIER